MAENLTRSQNSKISTQFQTCSTARILLVDDSHNMQDYVKHLLSWRYDVETVSNGIAALATVYQLPPDLALIDVMLLQLDGFELLRQLRANPKTKEIPIILLAELKEEEICIEGIETGADDYIIKPFTASELLVRVDSHLKRTEMQREAAQQAQKLQEEKAAVDHRVQDILESISDAFVALDYQWRYIYVNRQAMKLLHKTREELLGKVLWEVFPEGVELNLLGYRELHRAMREQVVVVFEDFSPTLNTWLEVHAYPIPEGLAVYFQDISGRKQVEKELRAGEARLRMANERFDWAAAAVNCLIYDWDLERNTVERTEGLTRLLGYSVEEADPSSDWWFQLCHPDDLESMRSAAEADWMTKDRWSAEYRVRHKDNYYIHVLDQAIVVQRDAQGKPRRMVGSTTDITESKNREAERQRAEENLRERELFLKNLTNNVPVLLWTALPDGTMDFVSQPWIDYTGLDLAQVRQQGWQALIHPDDLAETDERWLQAAQTGEPYEITHRLKQKDGNYPWCISRAVLTRDDQLTPLRWVGSAVDIDRQKQAEQALHQSLAILNTINEATPTLIYVKDRQGRMIMGNPALFRTVGKPESEIIGRTDAEFYPNPDQAVAIVATDRQIMETGQMQILEEVVSLPNDKCTFLSAKSPYRDEAGNIIGLIGVSFDITERKQTQEALRESEERLRVALEASKLGMWYWDLSSDTLTWTEQCKALFGLTTERQVSYEVFLEVLHPDDRQRTHEAVTQCMDHHQSYDIEYRAIWPDGTVRWIAAKGNCIYNATEQPIQMMGVAIDITERKQTEAELHRRTQELLDLNTNLAQASTVLQERNQELDQFVYVVSHDLKAPLRAISNLSQWIEDDIAEQLPPENRQQMQLLRERVNRMENLIDGLLNYSRINRSETATEIVNIAQLLGEIIDSLAPPASFTLEVAPELPTLKTQRLPLSQVFANLISNAIKHHGRTNGKVQILVDDLGKSYQFTVADDGQGIPAEYHEKIFAIFQTVGSNESKTNTGIGLAIVKKLVEKHGGTIRLESQIGQGTTFRFTWPKFA